MSYTFPLGFAVFANDLPAASFRWHLERYEESTGTGRGDILTREIAAPKWRADVNLRPMLPTVANDVQAMFEILGSSNTCSLYDLRKCNPKYDPHGLILGSHTVTVYALGSSGDELRLTGLPSGYKLARGDMLSIDAPSSRQHLHRITEETVAASSGTTPLFTVRPHIKVGTAAGQPVRLLKPYAKMHIVSYDIPPAEGRFVTGAGFTALEAY